MYVYVCISGRGLDLAVLCDLLHLVCVCMYVYVCISGGGLDLAVLCDLLHLVCVYVCMFMYQWWWFGACSLV
jgi:hypothetical protein